MEANKLSQQMSQRASSIDRLGSLMKGEQDSYFEDWRNRADGLWGKKMADYQQKMEGQLQEKTEGVALLADAPVFYQMGGAAYKYAPEMVQSGFDNIATSNAWGMAGDAVASVQESVGEAVSGIRTGIGEVGNRIASSILPESESPNADIEMGGGEVEQFSSTQQVINNLGADTGLEDALLGSQVTSEEAVASQITTAESGLGESVSTSVSAGAEVGAEVGVESGALAAEGTLAATGVGAPVAGLAAAATAVGFGLYDLFHHHHHSSPAAPAPPPPLQNRYTISSSILPSTQSAVSGGGQSMVF